jgi:hypothetical protein
MMAATCGRKPETDVSSKPDVRSFVWRKIINITINYI